MVFDPSSLIHLVEAFKTEFHQKQLQVTKRGNELDLLLSISTLTIHERSAKMKTLKIKIVIIRKLKGCFVYAINQNY